ncbi:MAG: hypothetical protein JKY61_02460 [Planctomycetes bacterium]|nr:hypothetical protein [Planctomycetota bacterium]
MLNAEIGFLGFLLLTVALLVAVAWTGFKAKRKIHIPLVFVTVASLGMAIRYALLVGPHYDLESAGVITPIHMFIARATTAAYLVPVITGIRTLKDPSFKRWHRKAAFLVIGLTLMAAVTGVAMLSLADRIPQ